MSVPWSSGYNVYMPGMVSDGTYMYIIGKDQYTNNGFLYRTSLASGAYEGVVYTITSANPSEFGRVVLYGGALYVSDAANNIIYKINNIAADPSAISQNTFYANTNSGVGVVLNVPNGMAIYGTNMYVANDGFIARIPMNSNGQDGTVYLANDMFGRVAGVKGLYINSANGMLYYTSSLGNIRLYSIDLTVGTSSLVEVYNPQFQTINDITYDSLFNRLYIVISGNITVIGTDGSVVEDGWRYTGALTVYMYNNRLYAGNGDGTISQFIPRDYPWSGMLSGSFTGNMAADSTGTYMYVDNGASIAEIRMSDGVITNSAVTTEVSTNIGGLIVSGTTLYVSSYNLGNIYTVDLANSYAVNTYISSLGSPISITIMGTYLYWCDPSGIIGRVSLSNPAVYDSPWVQNAALAGIYDITSYNNVLYGVRSGGIPGGIVTITDSGQITEINSFSTSFSGAFIASTGIKVYNDIIYVSLYNDSNPQNGNIATFQLDGTIINQGWQTGKNYGAITMYINDLYGYNVTNTSIYKFTVPLAPPPPPPPPSDAWSSGYDAPNFFKMISSGTYLYVDNGGKVARTSLDDGTILIPDFASGFTEDGVSGLAISGTTMYVAEDGTGTIWSYPDVNGDNNEQNYASGFTNFNSSLAIIGNYLYVGSTENGGQIGRVSILDANDKTTNWLVDSSLASLYEMRAYNNILYVLTRTNILSVDTSGNISTLYTFEAPYFGLFGMVIYGDTIYVTLENSNGSELYRIATFQLDGTVIDLEWQTVSNAASLAINGTDLYCSTGNYVDNIFSIYKFALPPAPEGPWSTGYDEFNYGKMVSDGTYLYVDNNEKFAKTSLADGTIVNPSVDNTYFIGGMTISGNTLYVGADGQGVIYSYSLPSGQINNDGNAFADGFSGVVNSLAIIGDYLYVSSYQGIGRVSLSDPSNDKDTEWNTDPIFNGSLYGMYAYNNILYVLTWTDILTVTTTGTVTSIYNSFPSSSIGGSNDIVVYNDVIYATIWNENNNALNTIGKFQLDGTVIDLEWQTVPSAAGLALDGSDLYCTSFADNSIYKFALSGPQPPAIVCFKEGSKILTELGYVPIETLRPGDRVMTALNGYKAIEMIGKREIEHLGLKDRIKDQLYKCSAPAFPEVFEDLVITGCHSILVDEFTSPEQRQKTAEVNNNIYITGNKYRLPACVDDRTTVYEEKGAHVIYHLALENEDYYMNYGIYANGLLVETCSRRYLKELANMELIL